MIVLALDLKDEKKALDVARETKDYIDAIKVNYPIVLSCGVEIMRKLSKIKPVIADFKIADIPYTSSLIAETAFESGAEAVICHGFVGRDVVKEILRVAKNFGGEVYVVTELTNEGAREFMESVATKIAKMARDLGCHGLIAPATKPEKVKEVREVAENLKILSPGIGTQGGVVESVAKLVDGIIVGRAIYRAENPKRAAKEVRETFLRAKKI